MHAPDVTYHLALKIIFAKIGALYRSAHVNIRFIDAWEYLIHEALRALRALLLHVSRPTTRKHNRFTNERRSIQALLSHEKTACVYCVFYIREALHRNSAANSIRFSLPAWSCIIHDVCTFALATYVGYTRRYLDTAAPPSIISQRKKPHLIIYSVYIYIHTYTCMKQIYI